jgi:hypothetical protein
MKCVPPFLSVVLLFGPEVYPWGSDANRAIKRQPRFNVGQEFPLSISFRKSPAARIP